MKRYRIEAIILDRDDEDSSEEVGDYVAESLEKGLGDDFEVENLAVYEVNL